MEHGQIPVLFFKEIAGGRGGVDLKIHMETQNILKSQNNTQQK